jgi:hypothetical protein
MKKFQIIIVNSKTEEMKIRSIIRNTFAAAASEAYVLARLEFERSGGQTWKIVAIYDMEHEFDLTRPTRG